MFEFPTLHTIILVAGVLLSFLVQYAGIIWRISQAERNLQERILTVEYVNEREIQKVRLELIQSKLEASQAYMGKDAFNNVMSNIDSRLIRLEGKLDQAIHAQS